MTMERRKDTVKLYPQSYNDRLKELRDQVDAAVAAETAAGPRRTGQKSKAVELAREHDAWQDAEEGVVEVEIQEISNTAWQKLADDHPPRPGDLKDQKNGLNMKTFPDALLRASVGDSINVDELSRLHAAKLERAAWDLHNGDDALGKLSLVSLLTEETSEDSRQQRDSE